MKLRFFALFLSAHSLLQAGVSLPVIFSPGMVLQRESPVPVWGRAEPGETVRVEFADQQVETKADGSGQWRVELAPLATSKTGSPLRVIGNNTLEIPNVVVGEVWFALGQSNMAMNLMAVRPERWKGPAIKPNPLIRYFGAYYQESAVQPMENGKGEWRSFVPAPIGIPAVAYSFAQQISERLDCPVGMVVAAMGDTPIEAWMRLQSLESDPSYEPVLKRYQKVESELKEKLPEWEAKMAEWEVINDKYKKEGQYADAKAIKDWEASKAEAEKSGEEIPPRPKPTWTARPQFPNGGAHTPTILYNGMVHPFIPFAMRGMIFYQGESNAKDPETYGKLFPLFIRDYRSMWGQGDFPFLFVQLANFEDPKSEWALLRESQRATLSEPNTGMAVAIDLGDPKDIHPLNKWDVGHRLALLARKLAYKEAIVASGPSFAGLLAEDNRLRIRFENVGTGLAIGAPPHPIPNHPPLPTDRLVGFEIAGADGQWLAADAKMEGADVVISHADVPQPTQVRYAWADSPSCNLYNQEGLPAVPFRAALSESGKPTVR